ncbi:hypothetical protein [Noviherbaspirillum sedimenti]|uniref:hypothetical protein n=1 Tax=Noviherbaspirillum sedimenti TaxID=2320865 RepID=UPI0011C489E1|nr:hypothetical protein [Noviherbaspirillum sedimenti]
MRSMLENPLCRTSARRACRSPIAKEASTATPHRMVRKGRPSAMQSFYERSSLEQRQAEKHAQEARLPERVLGLFVFIYTTTPAATVAARRQAATLSIVP